MGQVAVLLRIMPQSVGTDMRALGEAVRGAVPGGVTLRGMQVKDVAYGLQSLLVSATMADSDGLLPAMEEAIAKLPHVESVEVMEQGLL